MAGIAMLGLALVAAVAILFVLRGENDCAGERQGETTTDDREMAQ